MNYKIINKLNGFEYPFEAETDEEAINKFKEEYEDSLENHTLNKTIEVLILDGAKLDTKSNELIEEREKEIKEKLESEETNKVDHPRHYNQGKIETIEIIKSSMNKEQYKGFLKGNILKYICRSEFKENELEDLQKAQWYLNELIGSFN